MNGLANERREDPMNDPMEEHTKREESLREELLEWVTGAGCCVSTSRNPGSFLNCAECQAKADLYDFNLRIRDHWDAIADSAVRQGDPATADLALTAANGNHQRVQEIYGAMDVHGHPDFPAALRAQRRNYNPPN